VATAVESVKRLTKDSFKLQTDPVMMQIQSAFNSERSGQGLTEEEMAMPKGSPRLCNDNY
jgi:hypothetical protein